MTTIYDGIKYEYCVSKAIDGFTVDKLIEDTTDEHNGTEVKIYIKNSSDVSLFISACKSELIYFDNVYIDSYYDFINDYKILEYKTFKYREDTKYSNQLHLIIGKVPYPISWDEIDKKVINIPVGLKFNIGDLQVTPERESIAYIDVLQADGSTASTKDIILTKIEEFTEEIAKLYEEQTDYIFSDYQQYLKYQESTYCNLKLEGDILLDVRDLIKKPEGIFEPLQDFVGKLPKNLFFEYETTFLYQAKGKNKAIQRRLDYSELQGKLYLTEPKSGKLSAKKILYLFDKARELTTYSYFYTTHLRRSRKLSDTLRYLEIPYKSGSYDYSVTNATKQLKLYRDYLDKEFKRLTFDIDTILIDEAWLTSYNQANKINVKKGENSFLAYNYGYTTLAEKEYVTTKTLEDFTGFILYGFEENEDLIRNFRLLFMNSKYGTRQGSEINSKQVRLYKIAQRNQKYFLNLKNACYIEDFMGNNKIFKRFATAAWVEKESKATKLKGVFITERYQTKNSNILDEFPTIMEEIFPPVADAIKDLTDACDEYGKTSYTKTDNSVSEQFFNEVLSIAKEHKLFDEEMYETHQKLERYVAGLDLINYIACSDKSLPFLVDFLCYKDKKVDTVWTKPTTYETQLVDESLKKICYLLSVYSDEEYQNDQDRRSLHKKQGIKGVTGKTALELEKENLKLQKLKSIYNALLTYHKYEYKKRTN